MIAFNLEILAEYSYLQLPIQIGSEKIAMQITCEGKVVREFDAELAVLGKRNWWAHCDIREFRGKTIILKTIGEKLTDTQVSLLTQMITNDGLSNIQITIQHRPNFTPKQGGTTFNGLIYNHGTGIYSSSTTHSVPIGERCIGGMLPVKTCSTGSNNR
jgi:hypothetical protein